MLDASPDYIAAGLDAIEARHGSVTAYLEAELGIDAARSHSCAGPLCSRRGKENAEPLATMPLLAWSPVLGVHARTGAADASRARGSAVRRRHPPGGRRYRSRSPRVPGARDHSGRSPWADDAVLPALVARQPFNHRSDRLAGRPCHPTGDGRRVEWRRDTERMHAFHVDVPADAAQLVLQFQFLTPVSGDWPRRVITPDLLGLQWEKALLYPAGTIRASSHSTHR